MDGWKRSLEDYEQAAHALAQSMARDGFDRSMPVAIDRDGELLGGAHRVACALALELTEIAIQGHDKQVWADPWGYDWFKSRGMPLDELKRLELDMQAISE